MPLAMVESSALKRGLLQPIFRTAARVRARFLQADFGVMGARPLVPRPRAWDRDESRRRSLMSVLEPRVQSLVSG